MANYPGMILYPGNPAGLGAVRDVGTVTKQKQSGIARGPTSADYNVSLRGLGEREDKRPRKPYP